MTVRWAFLGGLLTFLLSVIGIVIQLRPYDGSNWRALVLPTDCEKPCFLHLIPGETSARDVVLNLVSRNDLEAQVEYRIQGRLRHFMANWDGYLFDPLELAGQMDLTLSTLPADVVADTFYVRWKEPPILGDLYLSLGLPDAVDVGFWFHDLGTKVSAILRMRYAASRVVVYARYLCPVAYRGFWTTPILAIRFSAEPLPVQHALSIEEVQRLVDCR